MNSMENKSLDFSLNIKNLRDIPFNLYEKNFTFHFNGKTYKTNRLNADLLSPLIRQLHYSDNTIDEFYLKIDNTQEKESKQQAVETKEDYFSDFLKLYTFENTKIDPKRQQIYSKYFYALGNYDEFFRLLPDYYNEISEDNALERLILLSNIATQHDISINLQEMEVIQKLINFISSHFESIDKEKMKQLNNDIIEKIINNENLKLHDEDSLLEFVLELYSKDENSYELFEYILFNNISEEMIEKFIDKFSIEYLNLGIWRSICQRLLGKEKSGIDRYTEKAKIEKFGDDEGRQFEGIMNHLTVESGGNIHDNGTVEITANSFDGSCHPKNLVDYKNDNYYQCGSNSKVLSSICFDFKDKAVNLSSYTMKSNGNSDGANGPKSWVVEVSKDGKNWKEIDRRENNESLKGKNLVFTFKVQKQNHGFNRFVQLRQTSTAWDQSSNYIWFRALEFNGELKYPPEQTKK
ncbi:hypothetical protein M9Y10_007352 [Tritrichomonas musculus]|uniref:F5/8 type C domain-containing protein n=1 Tax=Tritrichomonas musculus TaxID=1915356 RepID=A0ABR2J138_9EUKA